MIFCNQENQQNKTKEELMQEGIATVGLNGSGKSTLGHALAKELSYYEIDVEDYYFPEQKESRRAALDGEYGDRLDYLGDMPYSVSRTKEEVEEGIAKDIVAHRPNNGLIDYELQHKTNDKILKREPLVNEVEIDVAGKNIEEVLNEAIEIIDTRESLLDYEYVKPPKELFYSWVFANELR